MQTGFQMKVMREPEVLRCSFCHASSEYFIHFIMEHVFPTLLIKSLPLNQKTRESQQS